MLENPRSSKGAAAVPLVPTVDLRLFRYALASAKHGSFRRAADALSVEHSVLSRGIRDLERRVGGALFERGHAGIRLTAAGAGFIEEASAGFDHLDRALQWVRALQRGEHGELKVAISAPLPLLGTALGAFRQKYDGVGLEIAEATSSDSTALVGQRKVDIAFLAKDYGMSALMSLRLQDAPMTVVLGAGHRLAAATTLSVDDLRGCDIILGAGGAGPDVADYLNARDAAPERLQIRSYHLSEADLVSMVRSGFGVTVLLGTITFAPREGVILVPLASSYFLPLYAVWIESNPNPALKALVSILRHLVPAQISLGS